MQKLTQSSIIQPKQIKIKMYPHQLSTLYNARLLETNHLLKSNNNEVEYESKIGVIGNRVGSGKSLIILALLTFNNIYKSKNNIKNIIGNNLVIKYKKQNINSFTNIIVSPSHLINQWKSYIKNQTTLTYTSIHKLKDIDIYFPKFTLKKINSNNIILINEFTDKKNNKNLFFFYLTKLFSTEIILLNSTVFNYLVNTIYHLNLNEEINVNRIIFDESDTLEIENNILNANFYWFITSNIELLKNPIPKSKYIKHKIMNDHNIDSNIVKYKISTENGIQTDGFIKNIFEQLYNQNEEINIFIKCSNINNLLIKDYNIISENIILKNPTKTKIINRCINQNIESIIKNEQDIEKALNIIKCNKGNKNSIINVFSENITAKNTELKKKIRQIYEDNQKIIEINNEINKNKSKISNIRNKIYGKNVCPISNDEIVNPAICPNCKNIFEFSEIITWISIKLNCPLCRNHLNSNNLIIIDDKYETYENIDENIFDKIHEILISNHRKTEKNKTLIYSDYYYNINVLKDFFKKKKIAYLSINKKTNPLKVFHSEENSIFLINDINFICGLNLEETTDIIIINKINSINENRLIGCCNRIGKKNKTKVWKILYDDEI